MSTASYGGIRGSHYPPHRVTEPMSEREPAIVRVVSYGLNPVHTAGPANAYIVRLEQAGTGAVVLPMSREQLKAYEGTLLEAQLSGAWYRVDGAGANADCTSRLPGGQDTKLCRVIRAITNQQVVLDEAEGTLAEATPPVNVPA